MTNLEDDWDMCEPVLSLSGEMDSDKTVETGEGDGKVEEIPSNKADVDNKENISAKEDQRSNSGSNKVSNKHTDCLYHGVHNRSNFQRFLNLLRTKPNLLPSKYFKKVGRAICVCNTQVSSETTITSCEESDLKRVIDHTAQHFQGADKTAVQNTLKQLLMPDVQNSSVFKLYAVLCDAAKGVYSRLEARKAKTGNIDAEKEDKENVQPPKIKQAVTLPLPNEYVPHLIGKSGVHINALTTLHGVVLSVVSPSALRRVPYKAPLGPNVIVELTAQNQENIDAATDSLIVRSKTIISKREKHKQAMRLHQVYLREKWKKNRQLRAKINKERSGRTKGHSSIYSSIMYGTDTESGFMKEMDRESHMSKYKQHRRTGNTLKSKPAPVLEGSTCINCLGHYDGKTKNTAESCRYHPGYLLEASAWVEFRWGSCKHVARFTREEMIKKYCFDLTNDPSTKQAIQNIWYFRCKECDFKYGGQKYFVKYSAEKVRFWNCCKLRVAEDAPGIQSKEDKHELHQEDGCKTGLHTWRPQRSKKGSNRVKEQATGKKSSKINYDMTEISKGLKGINMGRHGRQRKAKMAIDEGIDGWVIP